MLATPQKEGTLDAADEPVNRNVEMPDVVMSDEGEDEAEVGGSDAGELGSGGGMEDD